MPSPTVRRLMLAAAALTLAASGLSVATADAPAQAGPLLRGVRVVYGSATHGWLLGTDAGNSIAVRRTVDGGATWTDQSLGAQYQQLSNGAWADASDGSHLFLLVRNSVGDHTLVSTSDGGATWNTRPAANYLTVIDALDNTHLWAVGRGGVLDPDTGAYPTTAYSSSNAGDTWTAATQFRTGQPAPYGATVFGPDHVSFRDATHGVVTGQYSGFSSYTTIRFATSDGGASWSQMSPGGANITDLQLAPDGAWLELSMAYSGSAPALVRSVDGFTWTPIPTPEYDALDDHEFSYPRAVAFIDATHGWLLAQDGMYRPVVDRTNDGGATWTRTTLTDAQPSAGTLRSDGAFVLAGANGCQNRPLVLALVDSGAGPATVTALLGTRSPVGSLLGLAASDATHAVASAWCAGLIRSTDGTTASTVDINSGTGYYNALTYASATTVVAVGQGTSLSVPTGTALVARSTDSGATWTQREVQAGYGLNSVSFGDATHGWALGNVGGAFSSVRTSDAGLTWSDAPITVSAPALFLPFAVLEFADQTHGWVTGQGTPDTNGTVGGMAVARTANAGATWTVSVLPSTVYVPQLMSWPTTTTGFLTVLNGTSNSYTPGLLRSTDAGATWSARPLPADAAAISGVSFADALHGWITGTATSPAVPNGPSSGAVWRTNDGGGTWTRQVLPHLLNVATAVTAVNSTTAWLTGSYALLGEDAWLMRTTDSGATWTTVHGPAARPYLVTPASPTTASTTAGAPVDVPVTLRNAGDAALHVSNAVLSGDLVGTVDGTCLTGAVASTQSCTLVAHITAAPEGVSSGSIGVTHDGAGSSSPAALPLQVTAYAASGRGQVAGVPMTESTYPMSLLADGDGSLWSLPDSYPPSVRHITSAGDATVYALDDAVVGTADVMTGLVRDATGAIWFGGNTGFGRLNTTTPLSSLYYPLPSGHTMSGRPVRGPDGRLWTFIDGGQLAAMTTGGVWTIYDIAVAGLTVYPTTGIVGTDTGLAFGALAIDDADQSGHSGLVRVSTTGGATMQDQPAAVENTGSLITRTGDGTVWLGTQELDVLIGFPSGAAPFVRALPGGAHLTMLESPPDGVDPDGALWFKGARELGTQQVFGRISTGSSAGQVWPTTLTVLRDLVTTGDGSLYASSYLAPYLFRITTGAEQTPPSPPDTTITAGPATNAWTMKATAFAFTSTPAGATFTCAVTGVAPVPCTSPWTTPFLTTGTKTATITARLNNLNDPSPAVRTWRVDATAPTAPTVNALSTVTLTGTATVTLTSGSDIGSGINRWAFRYRSAPSNAGFGALASPGTWASQATKTVTKALSPGVSYCFSGRERDAAGNWSPWSGEKCTVAPLDDRSLTASTSWARLTLAGAYRSTLTSSKSTGAMLKASLQARRLYLLADTCPTCGSVQVIWNGTVRLTRSLYSATLKHKVLFAVPAFSAVSIGTLQVKITSSNRTVAVDGFAAGRF